jgi:hypothetical protein
MCALLCFTARRHRERVQQVFPLGYCNKLRVTRTLIGAKHAVSVGFVAQRGFEAETIENKGATGGIHAAKLHNINIINRLAVWLPGMDSNHELDKILNTHNLLILQSC